MLKALEILEKCCYISLRMETWLAFGDSENLIVGQWWVIDLKGDEKEILRVPNGDVKSNHF